jgi:hypothetical protein
MHSELLIHLDTLGHMPSSAIIGLGAIAFDRNDEHQSETLYNAVSMASNSRANRTMDPESWDWWRTEAPYDTPFREPLIDLSNALDKFVDFVRSTTEPKTKVWFWSAATDGGILYSALESCGLARPWPYFRVHDVRTYANNAFYNKHGHYFASPSGDTPQHQMMRRARALRECFAIFDDAFAEPERQSA